ncbi:MAG: hypothetical protein H6Q28_1594, partial [Bacteroidetes bacterium]|nr:hypothetical protein [Bacteroidota bacterium]
MVCQIHPPAAILNRHNDYFVAVMTIA